MERLVFSSPGSARGLAEARRLSRWWDEYRAALGGIEVSADERMPLATSVEYLDLGAVGLGRSAGSINRFNRRGSKTVADGDDRFNLVINRGRAHTQAATRLGQAVIAPGSAILFDFAEQSDHVCPGGHKVTVLFMPRRLLRQMVPNAVDIAGRVVPASNEALRLLAYCADGLLDDENLSHPAVLARAG